MINYKIDFNKIEWKSKMEGIRDKCIDQQGIRSRLVEYSKIMKPHWCDKGHYPGPEHKHKVTILPSKVLVLFI